MSRRSSRPQTALTELAAGAWQTAAEFGLLLRDPVFWGLGVPHGDGHPVLVLPGLAAGDAYLTPLRDWLRRTGYTPIKSGIERNPGWSEELVAELSAVARRACRAHGRPVSVIGHSMGGLQGRSVAARHAEIVRQVITLGSPLSLSRSRLPASVRMTAIYTRADRIVRYPNALAPEPSAHNIEVPGSHAGLAFNPTVYRTLARLLRPGS